MAAPVAAARGTPSGIYLKNGHPTLVTISLDTDIDLFEINVTPPGVDVGDAIDTTTMHNDVWRTMAAPSLKTLTECQYTGAYDPDAYNQIMAVLGIEATLTYTFPDGSTLAFFGFVKMFEPGEITTNEMPDCTVTIVPTNFDPVNKVEAGPVLTSVEGT